MDSTKLSFKLGTLEFTGEGDEKWLSVQFDKLLDHAAKLSALSASALGNDRNQSEPTDKLGKSKKPANLVLFLKEKAATTVQTQKFLATAIFLQLGGKNRIGTSEVTQALRDASQTKLNNPSDCLNQNVAKGYCEKEGKSFFVTSSGFENLGVDPI